ncbi:hypothetical protein Hanom_Chr17g01526531 [Helianthus anomalus]
MELTSRMKMARFQTLWIQMRKNKPLKKSRKTGQTSGTKMAFYSLLCFCFDFFFFILRLTTLTEELTAEKLKYLQLQERVDAITSREDEHKGEADA